MILNDMGQIVSNCWLDLPNHYKNVVLDESLIMPNHFHGIVVFTDAVGVNHARMDDLVRNFVGAIHESPLDEKGNLQKYRIY